MADVLYGVTMAGARGEPDCERALPQNRRSSDRSYTRNARNAYQRSPSRTRRRTPSHKREDTLEIMMAK